jgi:tetratricopeptide (TPR) repeat protein
VQHKLPDLAWQAVHTQRRYFDHFECYGEPAKRHYSSALFNLAVYLRAVGEHEEALEQFKTAYEAARARKAGELADRCRRNAAWQALQLGKLELAEQLLAGGQNYLKRHDEDVRARTNQLLNEAQLLLLKDELDDAAAVAIDAAIIGQATPEHLAEAMDLMHRVGRLRGDIEGALALAILAKSQAERDERFDIANRLRASVRELALRYPEAVERFMRDTFGPSRLDKGGFTREDC